ncbi:EAL domain-containing protein [Fodinisporobacter ferrooxydans]|uniref:EAL domain-containing protein n=1 Tax=Fodinisporobacter ferrooxydans TaxID=2901836 RepID=A0ABY4CPD2_9BACL|nr:EAL domain-containing protein [Alicyclobacillaceae bacterium MYW30-H2]
MEALIRWQHPNRGLIPPLKFISVAEETGLIVPIGEWVLYTACKQNKEWQDAGFVPLRVSVNISARQFQNNLVATVKKILDKTGLAPQWLELEITESMLMINVEEAVQTLHQLKNLGVHLSIDDFGTGYSSLNYLKRFPIDCLKIDKSFVSDVLSDASIANAVITLGHNLNLQVIAEGIEKQEQAIALQKQNCDYGQGYFFGPPVSKQRFEHFLMGNSDNAALKISS